MKQTLRIEFKEINDRLVVLKADVMRELLESLSEKLVLFFFEDIGDVELLKFFVGKVDEELLQRVDFEDFKAEDVQQSDALPEALAVFFQIYFLYLYLLVQFCHQIQESLLV